MSVKVGGIAQHIMRLFCGHYYIIYCTKNNLHFLQIVLVSGLRLAWIRRMDGNIKCLSLNKWVHNK